MNLRFLQSIVAFADHESLGAAARALGLSHSAVSLQVKSLEDSLGFAIIDRTTRPARLTDDGLQLVDRARHMLALSEDIRAIGAADTLVGSVVIGVVPSALIRLMPPALASLRASHPGLNVQIRSGLSEQLVQDVVHRSVDLALVTQPDILPDGLSETVICHEPLDVIAGQDVPQRTIAGILTHNPFIWFSRRTWTGQQIEQHLRHLKMPVQTAMETDSIEAIEALVANGLGVSVSPRRVGFDAPDPRLRRLPFPAPGLSRGLSLVSQTRNPRRRVVQALQSELADSVRPGT
ncbi:MAG: LysR family transcriptional regulator [Jannaschia sp.]